MIEISKNTQERIRFQITEFRGQELVDIRVWVQGEDGAPVPTRKGITFKVDKWPEFRRALETLEAEILEAGLIEAEDLEHAEC